MTTLLRGPVFNLKLNGKPLSDQLMLSLEEATLEEELNAPTMLTVKFNSMNLLTGAWQGIDLDLFKLGDVLGVSMGLDSEVPVMTGEIVGLETTFGKEHSYLEIRAYDRLHQLRFGARSRSFRKMKDSDIAAAIASELKFGIQADDTKIIHPYLFQNNQSNYHFLLGRAQQNGYELAFKDKTLIFRQSREKDQPQVRLEYNLDLDSFTAELHTLTSGSAIEVRGWDIKQKKVISATVSQGSETATMAGRESGFALSKKAYGASKIKITDQEVNDAAEAERIGKAKYNTLLREAVTGRGNCSGNPLVRAGATIRIGGIGVRFSGIYYVVSTVHAFNTQGYTTEFTVKRTGL